MDATPGGPGTLYVVGTPIGNLDDLSPRAIATLGSCRLIAAEDTRRTRLLMTRHALGGRVISYHRFNEARRVPELLTVLAAGDSIALVTDAGTPGLSDPGALLVRRARDAGYRVVPIPGPSAITTLLSASGFPSGPFTFIGFLPPRQAARRAALIALRREPRPLVFFEAPHRILRTLDDLLSVFGDREICLGREMTKLHEEFLSGRIAGVRETLGEAPVRGEMTLIVAGCGEASPPVEAPRLETESPGDAVLRLMAGGCDRKDALRRVAKARGLSRRDVYAAWLRARRARDGGPEHG